MTARSESDRAPNWFEVAGVVVTALLHLLFQELIGFHGVFVIGAVLAWGYYLLRTGRRDHAELEAWGFRAEGLLPTFLAVSAAAALGVLGMALIAASRGHLRWHWHMAVAFALYPIWGVIQQFLVQALVARNLQRSGRALGAGAPNALVCAVLFGLVHAPGREIMLATFLLGCVFTPIYLRWHNLWPLGLYHGWLGVFFYYWVRGSDPLGRLFAR